MVVGRGRSQVKIDDQETEDDASRDFHIHTYMHTYIYTYIPVGCFETVSEDLFCFLSCLALSCFLLPACQPSPPGHTCLLTVSIGDCYVWIRYDMLCCDVFMVTIPYPCK